jgi:hypothetical protein
MPTYIAGNALEAEVQLRAWPQLDIPHEPLRLLGGVYCRSTHRAAIDAAPGLLPGCNELTAGRGLQPEEWCPDVLGGSCCNAVSPKPADLIAGHCRCSCF